MGIKRRMVCVLMILWITGQSGTGKTTLARDIIKEYGGIHIDADVIRRCWEDIKFSNSDRIENNERIYIISKALSNEGYDVVVSTICPFEEQRDTFKGVDFINL